MTYYPEAASAEWLETNGFNEDDDYPDWQEEEGPSCNICDALGHGYPGGGPCPLESPDPSYYAEEMAAGR